MQRARSLMGLPDVILHIQSGGGSEESGGGSERGGEEEDGILSAALVRPYSLSTRIPSLQTSLRTLGRVWRSKRRALYLLQSYGGSELGSGLMRLRFRGLGRGRSLPVRRWARWDAGRGGR